MLSYGCNIELDVIVKQPEKSAREPAREVYVYVESSGKKYHTKPDCSGMKNAKRVPISKVKKKYAPCKKCCK